MEFRETWIIPALLEAGEPRLQLGKWLTLAGRQASVLINRDEWSCKRLHLLDAKDFALDRHPRPFRCHFASLRLNAGFIGGPMRCMPAWTGLQERANTSD
jgi:hypothetical protein